MPFDHYLENALEGAIRDQDLDLVISSIQTLQKKRGLAALYAIDDQGKSFLFHALEFGNEQIANKFLEIQKNDEIIFAKTKNNKTLFHLAAEKSFLNTLQQLIAIAEEKNQLGILMQADNEKGLTILHVAAIVDCHEIINLLLAKIVKHKSLNELINIPDKRGNTALHLVLQSPAFKKIKDVTEKEIVVPSSLTLQSSAYNILNNFIRYGANLNFENDEGVSVLSLLIDFVENNITLFKQLDKKIQDIILVYYKELIIQHEIQFVNDVKEQKDCVTNIPHLKSIYFKLASMQSLQKFMLAQHEFNPSLPLRRTYWWPDKDSNYQALQQLEIPETTLLEMPLYNEKLNMEFNHEEGIKKYNNLTQPLVNLYLNNSVDNFIDQSNSFYLNEDRKILSNLHKKLTDYLNKLEASPLVPFSHRLKAIAIPTVNWSIFLSTVFPLMDRATTLEAEHSAESHNATLAAVLFLAIGGGFTLGSSILSCRFFNKPMRIPKEEWIGVGNDLKHLLEVLQKQQHTDNPDLLSIPAEKIDQLEQLVDYLFMSTLKCLGESLSKSKVTWCGVEVSNQTRYKDELILLLDKFIPLVADIREAINCSQIPLHLSQATPELVDKTIDNDSDLEITNSSQRSFLNRSIFSWLHPKKEQLSSYDIEDQADADSSAAIDDGLPLLSYTPK